MAFEHTRSRLEQWGVWANQTGIKLGYTSPMAVIMRDNLASNCTGFVGLSDGDAELIDRAVGQLKRVDLVCFECVILRYRYNFSTAKMGKVLKASRPTVEKNLFAAEAWLDRALGCFDKLNLSAA